MEIPFRELQHCNIATEARKKLLQFGAGMKRRKILYKGEKLRELIITFVRFNSCNCRH